MSRNLSRLQSTGTIQNESSAIGNIDFQQLKSSLLLRRLPILYDAPTETPSYLLDATLADFLPASSISAYPVQTVKESLEEASPLRPGHHLVYFPPRYPLSSLLPDGTDPEQSPGEPFVRRMWAGGHMKFFPLREPSLRLNGTKTVCSERIKDVAIKGIEGEEKIFVKIERRFAGSLDDPDWRKSPSQGLQLPASDETHFPYPLREDKYALLEERNIVFMREQSSAERIERNQGRARAAPKSANEPTFSVSLTPSPSLLFRFSALTFNAHRIHLDKSYCQEVEGYRNLLVHGPLSLVLMLEVLNRYLAKQYGTRATGSFQSPQREIVTVDYRNIAPLPAEEPMKVCLRDRTDGKFDIWVEDRDGCLAVKGTAETMFYEEIRRIGESEP